MVWGPSTTENCGSKEKIYNSSSWIVGHVSLAETKLEIQQSCWIVEHASLAETKSWVYLSLWIGGHKKCYVIYRGGSSNGHYTTHGMAVNLDDKLWFNTKSQTSCLWKLQKTRRTRLVTLWDENSLPRLMITVTSCVTRTWFSKWLNSYHILDAECGKETLIYWTQYVGSLVV